MEVGDLTLEKTLQKLRILFLWTGLRLYNQTKPSRIFYLFNFAWLHTDLLATTTHMIFASSFVEVLFLAPCLAFSMLGDIKAICYKINDSEIHQLIDDLMKLETRKSTNSEQEKGIKVAEISFLNKVIKVFIVLTGLMIFVFNVGPLPLIALTYYTTGEIQLFLPFLDIYPINALQMKYWPFAYMHQIWSVFVALFYACSMDCILFVCCTFLRIQFRILQVDIKNIIPVQPISREKFRGDMHFESKFKELLKLHQVLIRLSYVLENIFSRSILLNFLSSSLIICLTGFNVLIVDDITLVVTFVIFLIMGLLQVWCLCYFGELLMSSSTEVSDAVYESQWYLASGDICKQLVILQTRAQQPCKLTASGFADVNLSAFMKILSKAWSYFALLNTIYTR